MNNFTLRQLETFLAVAETGGFRRAGEHLHRSQSAISAHVRQLEDSLGVALFHRTTRRVQLTPEGDRLLSRARRALAEIQAGIRELQDEVALQRGRVVIGAPPTISSTRLPVLLAEFQQRFPGITVQVREEFATGIMDRLRRQETDFAVTPRLDQAREFRFRRIMQDDFRVVLPPRHRLAGRPEVTLADIAGEAVLTLPPATALRQVLDDAFRERGLHLEPAFEVMHHMTLIGMVGAGLGVSILPGICFQGRAFAHVATARLTAPALSREICLVTLKGQALSPAARACADLIRQRFANPSDSVD